MRPISHLRALAFGSGSIAVAAAVVTPQLLLLYFLTEILGVPPAWAGLAVLVPKLWEFIFDPLIGHFSDQLARSWGRRVPFLAAGTLLFAPSFALLFAPPHVTDWRLSLAIVTVSYVVCTSAYSIFAVPFITLPGEVSDDPAIRTRVVAWRIGFVGIGILAAGGLAPVLVQIGGGGRAGYAFMGVMLSALCGVVMAISTAAARGFAVTSPAPPPGLAQNPIHRLLASRAYRWLWISYVVQMIAAAGTAASLPYAAKHILHLPASGVATLFIAITAGNLVSMPVWVALRARLGGLGAYRLASIACVLGSASLFVVQVGGMMLPITACVLAGIGQAGQQLLPLALLPAAARAGAEEAGAYHAGLFTGIWVAGEKLGFALGGAMTGFLLGAAGYVAGGGAQTAGAIAAIPWTFALVPAMIYAASLVPLLRLKGVAPGLGD